GSEMLQPVAAERQLVVGVILCRELSRHGVAAGADRTSGRRRPVRWRHGLRRRGADLLRIAWLGQTGSRGHRDKTEADQRGGNDGVTANAPHGSSPSIEARQNNNQATVPDPFDSTCCSVLLPAG